MYPNGEYCLLLNYEALLLQSSSDILVDFFFELVIQNENVNLVIGLRVGVGALIDACTQFVLLSCGLLLQIFNLFLNDSLRIHKRLSCQIKHLHGVIALIHVLQNLLAHLERLLLRSLRIFFVVFIDDARFLILACFTLDFA